MTKQFNQSLTTRGVPDKHPRTTAAAVQADGEVAGGLGGVGPLLVGNKTEPSDLDVFIEYSAENPNKGSHRHFAAGFKASKLTISALLLVLLLGYGSVVHDPQIVRDSLEAIRALFGSRSHHGAP
jgi:hypothetical protein